MHAANATTQAATAMIEMTSSVLTYTPLVSVSGDPCRLGMGAQLQWSLRASRQLIGLHHRRIVALESGLRSRAVVRY
jgi:hypothetical protein